MLRYVVTSTPCCEILRYVVPQMKNAKLFWGTNSDTVPQGRKFEDLMTNILMTNNDKYFDNNVKNSVIVQNKKS